MKKFKGTPGPWFWENGVLCNKDFIVGGDGHHFHNNANRNLISAAPELLEALQWALPLAKIAMSSCQLERVKCGHSDITGTYKDGVTWAGIYQDEVDSIESAESAINKALGE